MKKELPKLRRAIVIEPHAKQDDFVTDLEALMKKGKASLDRAAIERRWKAVDPEDVATLIYTSGTTGNPKGVMLCHRNLVSNIQGISDFLSIKPGMRDLQFLPMCHSFGRMEVLGFMMYRGVVSFAESVEKISDNFKEVRPQVFITVPRLLEKVHAKIMAGVQSGSAVKKALFSWALGVGARRPGRGWRSGPYRRPWGSSSGWPTSWSSPRSRRPWGASWSTWSTGRPRSPRRSRSSSRPRGSPSSVPTASPRRRPA